MVNLFQRNDIKLKDLVISSEGRDSNFYTFQKEVPKALDIFVLKTSTGKDSKVRRYVVHDANGDQEPVMIFHSLEHKSLPDGNFIMLFADPPNFSKRYQYTLKFAEKSDASTLLGEYINLKNLRLEKGVRDLEALAINKYPNGQGESSNRTPAVGKKYLV